MTTTRLKFFLFIFVAILANSANANLSKYVHVRETLFWDKLYTEKYHTLYCAKHHPAGAKVDIALVYSIDWIANAMNCPDTSDCPFARYKDAVADMHNWWPMEAKIDEVRKHYVFAEGQTEQTKQGICHFKIHPLGVEPREWAKGEIARSVLHMLWKYRLPHYGQIPLMVEWAKKFPPNAEEKWRNEKIKELQGVENRFISDPTFIDIAFPDPEKY